MTVIHPIPVLISALDAMTDDQVLEAHRIVSRRAQIIRLSDPEYLHRYEMGKAASRLMRRDWDSSPLSETAA